MYFTFQYVQVLQSSFKEVFWYFHCRPPLHQRLQVAVRLREMLVNRCGAESAKPFELALARPGCACTKLQLRGNKCTGFIA